MLLQAKINMILIGIAGKKQSGKDCLYMAIHNLLRHTHVIARVAFADALKQEVCRGMLVDRAYLEAHKENFRLILQGWATDFRRKLCGDDYWINRWQEIVKGIESTPNLVIVVPDVRFLNEASIIKKMGGTLIKIERRCRREEDKHKSETEMDSCVADYVIDNSDSIQHLIEQAKTFLTQQLKIKL